MIPGEDGGVLRFRQHGGRQPKQLSALPVEGDLLPAAETIPAPALPQGGHQVCVFISLFLFESLVPLSQLSVTRSSSPHIFLNYKAAPGNITLWCPQVAVKEINVEIYTNYYT